MSRPALSTRALKAIEQRIQLLVARYRAKGASGPEEIFLDATDFQFLFAISPKVARRWRKLGYVGFTQLRGRTYYNLASLQQMLKQQARGGGAGRLKKARRKSAPQRVTNKPT